MIEPRMYIKKCFADLVVKYRSIFGKDKTMTDKQIIIDGVDVSGCKYYLYCNKENCSLLQAKEQECEELKKLCNGLDRTIDNYTNLIELRNQQLDQLKAELTRANCQIADDEILQCDMREAIEKLKAENEELKKKCNIYTCGICGNKEDCNKLYNTLTEIKEIAE